MTRYFTSPDYVEKVLSFIATFIRDYGYPPTGQEMSDAGFGSTKVEAKYILDHLEEIGEIERNKGARAFRLTRCDYETFTVAGIHVCTCYTCHSVTASDNLNDIQKWIKEHRVTK